MMPLRPLGPDFYVSVREKMRAIARARDVDGVLLLAPDNVVYATGFFHSAGERPLGLYVPAQGDPILFVPLLERDHATASWTGSLEVYPEFPGRDHPVLGFVRRHGITRLAIDTVSADVFVALGDDVTSLVLVANDVMRLRAIKTAHEIELTRAAARFADHCLEAILAEGPALIRKGGTERDLLSVGLKAAQNAMEQSLDASFATTKCAMVGTVHSGPRAALPHGKTIDRRPLPGEPIIAGIGAAVGGYHAESGATFVLGELTTETRRCLTAADAADRAAREALRAGALCEAADHAAARVFVEAGLGDSVRHRIGHAMGVQNHEGPFLCDGDKTMVDASMVFSSEPGLYRPGIDGYRNINTLIVHPDRVEVPSLFQDRHPFETRVLPL